MSPPVVSRPVRRVEFHAPADLDVRLGTWPFTLAPVAQLVRDGLDLAPGVTFLVGENGSGKSTLVEAIAMAYGLGAEGGSRGVLHRTRDTESPLHTVLRLERSPGAARWGYFLRAETAHGLFSFLEDNPSRSDPDFHRMSHGESFLAMLGSRRFLGPGFYCLDEPESALSFSSCLGLVAALRELADTGSQVLCATHSPVLTALPGATILQLGEDGYAEVRWEELELVGHWRRYLADPRRYLRHVLE